MKIMRKKIDAARTTKGAGETMARNFAGPVKARRGAEEGALPRQEIWDHPEAAPHWTALLNPRNESRCAMQAGREPPANLPRSRWAQDLCFRRKDSFGFGCSLLFLQRP